MRGAGGRADEYLHRLIALGHRVAVCEQTRGPGGGEEARRQERGAARRGAPRHAGHAHRGHAARCAAQQLPGGDRADARVQRRRRPFALAWIDISTGEFRIAECDRAGLAAELARLEPREIIVSDALYGDAESGAWSALAARRDAAHARPVRRRDRRAPARRLFRRRDHRGFGTFSRLELTAAAACVTYVERTQLGKRPPLSPPAREAAGGTLQIDAATRGNLELIRTLAGERRGSLLAAIDRTATAAGSRLLAQRLAAPLTDPDGIGRGSTRSRPSWATPRARCGARRPQRRARSRPRARAAGGRPRRPARSRRHPRRARRRRPRSPAMIDSQAASADEIAAAQAALRAPEPALARRADRARSPTICRFSSATAASCAPATTQRSTRRGRCATNPAG